MRYDQVDLALSFLENPGDEIVLQVPYHRDIKLVRDYIVELVGVPIRSTQYRMVYEGEMMIHFELAQSDTAGYGYICPAFFIERDHDPHTPGVEYA